MSLKTELKMHVLHEQGVRADDALEAAQQRQQAHGGAKEALRVLAKNLGQLAAVVDKDLEDGKIPIDEPLKVAEYVKLMIGRAANAALTQAQHQENLQIATGGEITAYRHMVEGLKKELLQEKAKLAAQQAAATEEPGSGPGHGRPSGVHPGSGIAAQRRAETAADAEAPAEAAATDAESPTEAPPLPLLLPEANGHSKKRGGKRKGA